MNTAKLRSKRVLVPTVAAVALLSTGGVVWASTANADLQGSERDRVSAVAIEAVGGGKVDDVESSDGPGEAYEVEIRKADGTEVDVSLDKNLRVIGQDVETPDGTDDADGNDADGTDARTDAPDADDRVLSSAERTSAEKAALAAVGGGAAARAEAGDDPGEAYEVDVRKVDGTEWDVALDADFLVLHKAVDH